MRASTAVHGVPPLPFAAVNGRFDAIKMLLRAKTNSLLPFTDHESGRTRVPLDTAALDGHLEVKRELVREVGVDGCSEANRGVKALRSAAMEQHLDVIATLRASKCASIRIFKSFRPPLRPRFRGRKQENIFFILTA